MPAAASEWLLDANLLIALTQAAHVHHAEAHHWMGLTPRRRWATCALTQLAFVRLTSNPRVVGSTISPAEAMQALGAMTAGPHHAYWDDAPAPLQSATLGSAALVGHRQVTDAYLLDLAVARSARLATLDRGLASFAQALGLARHVEWVGTGVSVQEPKPAYRIGKARSSGAAHA